ncbi:unnamed protein product [Cunninghamella blakesleeana]
MEQDNKNKGSIDDIQYQPPPLPTATGVQFANCSPFIIPTPIYNSPSTLHSTISSPTPASLSMPTSPPPASHVSRNTASGSLRQSNFATDTFRQEKIEYEEPKVFGMSNNNNNNDNIKDNNKMYAANSAMAYQEENDFEISGRSYGQNKGFLPLATSEEELENQQQQAYSTNPLNNHQQSNMDNSHLQRGNMMDPYNTSDPYGKQRSGIKRLLLGPNKRPWFSWLSGLLMLIILIYEFVRNHTLTDGIIQTSPFNPMIGPSFYTIVNVGGKFTPCMRSIPNYTPSTLISDCFKAGSQCSIEELCGFGGFGGSAPNQSFRFFIPIFMHAGIIHFLLNMLTHLRLGADLERAYGLPRYLVLYFSAGLFGNVLSSMLAQPLQVSLGCSGALFGLIGAMFIDVLVNWKVIPHPTRELMKLLVSTIISLVLGLLPGLDNFAHIGGFIVGVLVGMIIIPMRPMASRKGKLITWGLRGLSLGLTIVLFSVCITTFYNSPDPSQICPNCKYLSCLPVSNFCDM